VRELERLRDDCLVDVLQALRGNGVGAGETLAEYERTLLQGERDPMRWETRVLPEWVDYNGHATESSYLLVTSQAADGLLTAIGIDADYLRDVGSYYTVETHICHLGEAKAGDRLVVTTQVLGADEKRIHIFVRIARDDTVLATVEQMLLHVAAGRAAAAREDVRERALALVDGDIPERVGRRIAMPA
jgi:carnitine 3-dehydrogenase